MMDYRAQRGICRRRCNLGGVVGILWMFMFLSLLGSHWFWTWLWIGLPLSFWVSRPMFQGNPMNQPQFSAPPGFQQQEPPEYPSDQQGQVSQPYNQGYTAQQTVGQFHETYREASPLSQYQAGQQGQQYEEPLTMYPQE